MQETVTHTTDSLAARMLYFLTATDQQIKDEGRQADMLRTIQDLRNTSVKMGISAEDLEKRYHGIFGEPEETV